MKFEATILPQHNDIVFLFNKETQEYVAFRVHDAEAMDHEQELAWKQQNINYGGCEPNDHMFYLTFEEFNLKHTPEADDEIRDLAAKLLLQASNFWHDHYLSKMN